MKHVKISAYRVWELPQDIQTLVCQAALNRNSYRDEWEQERTNSFTTICDLLDLSYSWDSDGNCHVSATSPDYAAAWIHGASRVIAYVVNRWQDFKKPIYVDWEEEPLLYTLIHKAGNALPKSWQEPSLPTGYSADYCFYEAYEALLAEARKDPHGVTLDDFCRCLAKAFECECHRDYEWAHSIEYAKEICQGCWYTAAGRDITDIV